MKKNKKIIIVITTICVLIILLLMLIFYREDKSSDNSIQNNKINNSLSNQNNDINILNNIVSNNTTINNTENNISVEKTSTQLYKEKLLDTEWIKNNLYMKEDCFGNEISDNSVQSVKFIKTGIENLVIVNTECRDKLSNQCFILKYDNNEIKVTSLEEKSQHIGMTSFKVSIKDKILYKRTTDSYEDKYSIYNITDNGLEIIGNIKKVTKIDENNVISEFYNGDSKITETQYNQIQNKYIKDYEKKDDFKIINSATIDEEFGS